MCLEMKELFSRKNRKEYHTAFFGGAFICGGNGGTRIIKIE